MAEQNETEPSPAVVGVPANGKFALTVLAALALVYTLQWGQSVFIPLAIGVLMAYALEPFVMVLSRARVPRMLGAAVVLLAFVGILGLGIYSLSGQVLQIIRQIPEASQRIRERVTARDTKNGALGEVQKAATELQRTAEVASAQSDTQSGVAAKVQKVQIVEPAFDARSYLIWGGMNLVGAAGQFTVLVFLVYFFLVTGHLYKRKIVKIAGPALWQKKVTIQILDEINQQISSFIRVQLLVSAIVAVATAVALWLLGVQQFIVWGLLAGILNSIPYLGPFVVSVGLTVVAFVQFDDVQKSLMVAGVALLITNLEGYLLTPALMSRAARMNPVAVFVGLLFWSWIWGIWGAVLAVPMLMMVKAVCDHIEDLQPVGELLGE